MSEFPTHLVPANFNDAHINAERYQAMYKRSIEDPDAFWGEMASEFLSKKNGSECCKTPCFLTFEIGLMGLCAPTN